MRRTLTWPGPKRSGMTRGGDAAAGGTAPRGGVSASGYRSSAIAIYEKGLGYHPARNHMLSGVERRALADDDEPRAGSWWRILLIGLGLFVLSVIVFALTQNPNLFPTVALIGNFLVPVSYVAFFYERRHMSQVTLVSTARAFFYGGVLGVFAAALLEPVFIRRLTFESSFVVGLIEEFAKILGVLVVARHHRHDSEIDGVILGGAAGMGFAALESSGYVFTAFVGSGGSLSALVLVTLLRGLL